MNENDRLKLNSQKRKERQDKAKIRNKNIVNLTITIFVIVACILAFLLYRQNQTIIELRNRNSEIVENQESTQEKIDQLSEQIKQSNSLEYIEKRAREELGMIKEGESIYVDSEEFENNQDQTNENNQETDSEEETNENN